jgi:hypothetical protein
MSDNARTGHQQSLLGLLSDMTAMSSVACRFLLFSTSKMLEAYLISKLKN